MRTHAFNMTNQKKHKNTAVHGMFPYICHQEGSDTINGLVFYIESQTVLNKERIISNVMRLAVQFINTTNDYKETIVKFLISHGEHVGTVQNGLDGVVTVMKAANQIAVTTHRGPGNMIICHEDDLVNLSQTLEHLNMMTLHSLAVPDLKGKIILLYRGNDMDGAPILVTSSNGKCYQFAREDATKDFVKIMDLE